MLPIMRRPRPRPRAFWAWTLTLTAALLAVVWVGSMKVNVFVHLSQTGMFINSGGIVVVRHPRALQGDNDIQAYVRDDWAVRWWFRRLENPISRAPGGVTVTWRIPLWPFVLLTGVPGVWMLVKTRRRTNPNACPACGYDRTGLPQSPTGPAPCPECGKSA